MQFVRLIVAIACWLILGLVVYSLVQTGEHPKVQGARATLKNNADTLLDNLVDFIFPKRRHPVTTIELEENLKSYLPVPFTNFTQEDWDRFWHLLYDRFTQDEDRWPKRKRQLTKDQAQQALAEYYYQPFGSFNQRQWDIFWQHILKGRVFK